MANTTFRMAPWADALFAMDKPWWDEHRAEVMRSFDGERYSSNLLPVNYQVKRPQGTDVRSYGNSGAGAIALAAARGARRVIMLGYDCQYTGGRTHWHGSHPKGLGDAGSIGKWPAKFAALAKDLLPRVRIINASRATALDMFERMELEACLALP